MWLRDNRWSLPSILLNLHPYVIAGLNKKRQPYNPLDQVQANQIAQIYQYTIPKVDGARQYISRLPEIPDKPFIIVWSNNQQKFIVSYNKRFDREFAKRALNSYLLDNFNKYRKNLK